MSLVHADTHCRATREVRAGPDPANADRYVEIRGRARVEPDDDYAFAKRLAAKYGGVDPRSFDGPGGRRVVVTLEPVNVYAVDVSAMLAQDAPALSCSA